MRHSALVHDTLGPRLQSTCSDTNNDDTEDDSTDQGVTFWEYTITNQERVERSSLGPFITSSRYFQGQRHSASLNGTYSTNIDARFLSVL